MKTRIKQLERLCERLYLVVSWFTLFAVLCQGAVVALRYYFEGGLIVLQESVIYLHIAYLAFGVVLTQHYDQHVRVDFLYGQLSERTRLAMDLFGNLVIIGPVGLAILWYSLGYVAASWSIQEGSAEAGGLPGLFLMKTLIPIMGGLIAAHAVTRALSILSELRQARNSGLS